MGSGLSGSAPKSGRADIPLLGPVTFVESGNTVMVALRLESVLKKNGRALKNDSVHHWTFDDNGLVKRYQHFNDTAQELAAWNA